MRLTDVQIRLAEPREKGYSLNDGADGLYLWIAATGAQGLAARLHTEGAAGDPYPGRPPACRRPGHAPSPLHQWILAPLRGRLRSVRRSAALYVGDLSQHC